MQRVLTSLHNVLFLYLDRPKIRCAKSSEGENVNGESAKFWVPYASHKAHNSSGWPGTKMNCDELRHFERFTVHSGHIFN